MSTVDNSIERLRQLWTPGDEVEQVWLQTEPVTELDSIVRDLFHRVVQQHGPFTVILEAQGQQILNQGSLRWECAGVYGYRELSLWIEESSR